MAAFELDNTMLNKIDRIHKMIMTLNTMENNQTKVSYQVNQERMIIAAHKFGDWDFPIYTFQRAFVELNYALLDQVIQELQFFIKYPYRN